MKKFTKDPDAVLDFPQDWTKWLGSDTIVGVAFSVLTGSIVVDSFTIDGTGKFVTAWISGGTVGQKTTLRTRVTTALGRIDDRTVEFKIVER